MSECDVCGREENMPYQCGHCGGTYCADHRLPEAHDCPGLDNWNDPQGVFDSGFDDSVNGGGSGGSGGVTDRFGINTGPGSVFGYFRGNVNYLFLAVMAIVFVLQRIVLIFVGPDVHQALFVLSLNQPFYVWTWITSIFAHGGIGHIVGNGIIIYFFGRLAEQQMGSKKYALFFLGTGVLAGLGQIGLQFLQAGISPYGVLGASGAALGILGFVTVIKPDLSVLLYFLIPVPIWAITIFYALVSVGGILAPGSTALTSGNIGHTAHLVGLLIGLWYGKRIKDRARIPGKLQLGRGPGGPGGPGGRGPF